MSEPEEQVERLLRDAEVEVKERDIQGEGKVVRKEEVERPMPRVTEADKAGDTKSLNRLMQKTLYMVVNRGKGEWGFPSAELARQESLHTVSRYSSAACEACSADTSCHRARRGLLSSLAA